MNNQPVSRFCHKCGAAAHPQADFCMACGERLVKFQTPVQTAPAKKERSAVGEFFLALVKCLGYYGFYLGVQVVVIAIYAVVLSIFFHASSTEYLDAYYKYIHEISIVMGILTIAGFVAFFKIRKKSFIKEASVKPISIGSAGAMVAFGISSQVIISILLALFYSIFMPGEDTSNEALEMLFENGNVIVQFLNVSVMTGILEEVLFRGLIHTTLKKAMPTSLAVFLSSVIFGAAHMNLEQFFYATILGLLLALVYEKKGTLLAPILIHMSFNGASFLLSYLNFESDLAYIAIFFVSVGLFLITAGMIFFTNKVPKNSLNPTEE